MHKSLWLLMTLNFTHPLPCVALFYLKFNTIIYTILLFNTIIYYSNFLLSNAWIWWKHCFSYDLFQWHSDKEMRSFCFICGIDSYDFENKPGVSASFPLNSWNPMNSPPVSPTGIWPARQARALSVGLLILHATLGWNEIQWLHSPGALCQPQSAYLRKLHPLEHFLHSMIEWPVIPSSLLGTSMISSQKTELSAWSTPEIRTQRSWAFLKTKLHT